jgi:hypothetical protein
VMGLSLGLSWRVGSNWNGAPGVIRAPDLLVRSVEGDRLPASIAVCFFGIAIGADAVAARDVCPYPSALLPRLLPKNR